MKTTIANVDYYISFEHVISKGTNCTITKAGFIPFSSGETFLSVKDKYDKEVGRKLSLARALKNTNFTKEQRKQVWNTYMARKIDKFTI